MSVFGHLPCVRQFLESNGCLGMITNSIAVLWEIGNSYVDYVFQPIVDVFATAYLYLLHADIDYSINDYLTNNDLTISHKE